MDPVAPSTPPPQSPQTRHAFPSQNKPPFYHISTPRLGIKWTSVILVKLVASCFLSLAFGATLYSIVSPVGCNWITPTKATFTADPILQLNCTPIDPKLDYGQIRGFGKTPGYLHFNDSDCCNIDLCKKSVCTYSLSTYFYWQLLGLFVGIIVVRLAVLLRDVLLLYHRLTIEKNPTSLRMRFFIFMETVFVYVFVFELVWELITLGIFIWLLFPHNHFNVFHTHCDCTYYLSNVTPSSVTLLGLAMPFTTIILLLSAMSFKKDIRTGGRASSFYFYSVNVPVSLAWANVQSRRNMGIIGDVLESIFCVNEETSKLELVDESHEWMVRGPGNADKIDSPLIE